LEANDGLRGQRQSAYRILVASSPELVAKGVADLWDSGKISSSIQNNIPYSGRALKSGQTCFWKVKTWNGKGLASNWSVPAQWEMGLLQPGDWKALWVNDGKNNPTADQDFYAEDPAPLFRREFQIAKTIKRARLYIAGLGYFEASLNGKQVGNELLQPGWTRFDKRVLYSTFDVTQIVSKGKNCIGVTLGNGWYNPLPLRMWGNLNLREHLSTGRPRFIAQLRLEFEDGSSQTIVSSPAWKVADGPILRNSIFLGEVFDARREQPGWNKPGFQDSEWRSPAVAIEKVGNLTPQSAPPIRITATWSAVKVTEPKPGVFIYDMGVNFAGLLRLRLNVVEGTQVQIRYGELLAPTEASIR